MTQTILPPEAQLALLPYQDEKGREAVLRLVEGPLDWERLLTLSFREQSLLHLWRNIRDSGHETDTEEVSALRQLAQVWEFKLIHLERLFFEAMDAFEGAGLDVLVLKGAATAVSGAGGFQARPMFDVDLLVQEDQAEQAWRAARELGWVWDEDRYPWDSYVGAHHLPPLSDHFGAGIGLEIHTRLWMPDSPFSVSDVDVWKESVTVDVAGRTIRIPSVNDRLHHCCVHFAWSHQMMSHGWRTFHDLQRLVESEDIDWKAFTALARSSGTETSCYWSLRLAASVAGVPVPDGVVDQLRPDGPAFALKRLEQHFALNLIPDQCPSERLRDSLWRMGIQRGKGSAGIALPDAPTPKGIGSRLSEHLGRLDAWFRYILKFV